MFCAPPPKHTPDFDVPLVGTGRIGLKHLRFLELFFTSELGGAGGDALKAAKARWTCNDERNSGR